MLTHMSYSSLPAVAVRSALRSMVYISYCNDTAGGHRTAPRLQPGGKGRRRGPAATLAVARSQAEERDAGSLPRPGPPGPSRTASQSSWRWTNGCRSDERGGTQPSGPDPDYTPGPPAPPSAGRLWERGGVAAAGGREGRRGGRASWSSRLRAGRTRPGPHLDVEVRRVEGAGRDQPRLGCPQVLGHQLPGSLHQELAVTLGRHDPGSGDPSPTRAGPSGAETRVLQPPPLPERGHCACATTSSAHGAHRRVFRVLYAAASRRRSATVRRGRQRADCCGRH